MNTTEVKTKGIVKSFPSLWKYARKQFLEYEKLEGIDNWKERDFSIDCSADQMLFKDMLQIRCVEELTEAAHALDNRDHFEEEITDTLNFFLSAYCMLDVDFEELEDPEKILERNRIPFPLYSEPMSLERRDSLFAALFEIVNDIGDLCNLLKNRPWAQSNYLVSMLDFDIRLKRLWHTFWKTLSMLDFTSEKLFDMFERKYLVNSFRMKTGY